MSPKAIYDIAREMHAENLPPGEVRNLAFQIMQLTNICFTCHGTGNGHNPDFQGIVRCPACQGEGFDIPF